MPTNAARAKDIRAIKVIGVVLALGSSVGYAGHHAVRSIQESRVAVAKRRAALDIRIRELEIKIAANKRNRSEHEATPNESPWRVAGTAAAVPNGPPRTKVVAPNPRVLALYLSGYRARLTNTYEALYQGLGLTTAQIAEFENLLTAHQEMLADIRAVALADGLTDSSQEVAALWQEEADSFRAAQITLLGDAGFQQLQQANRIGPIRGFADTIERNTGFPPEPLTGAQAQQLTAVLASSCSSYQSGGPVDLSTIDWDAVLPQAQGILSATQFEGLKESIYSVELAKLGRDFSQGVQSGNR